MTDATLPSSPAAEDSWERLRDRAEPWLAEAFAGVGGLIVLTGATALGSDYSQNWAKVTVGLVIVVAYLAEAFVPRPVQTACIATLAVGIPIFVGLIVFPVHSYNGFRVLQLATIAGWLAVFAIGGTRGRVVFLGLALFFVWSFAVLEAGHVQDVGRTFASGLEAFGGPSVGGSSNCDPYTVDDQGNLIANPDCDMPAPRFGRSTNPTDHALDIAFVSSIFGLCYLAAIGISDTRGRRALATAYCIPAAFALTLGVIAFGVKAEKLWVGGLLAIIAGLLIGVVTNGRRRFTTWYGAIAAGNGVLLFSGDVAQRWFDSQSGVVLGLTWILTGSLTVAAAIALARWRRDPYARPFTSAAGPPSLPDLPPAVPMT